MLLQDFRVFMSSKTEQAGHPIVPTETLNKILDFLPQLQSFNEMLLKDLTDRITNWSVVVRVLLFWVVMIVLPLLLPLLKVRQT